MIKDPQYPRPHELVSYDALNEFKRRSKYEEEDADQLCLPIPFEQLQKMVDEIFFYRMTRTDRPLVETDYSQGAWRIAKATVAVCFMLLCLGGIALVFKLIVGAIF
jgi:hypothetical protein